MQKPIIEEVFTDNGAHSHWVLISVDNGEKLWSEDPIECAAKGFPVVDIPKFLIDKASKYDQLGAKIGRFYENDDTEGDLINIGEIASSHFGYI